MKAFIFDCFVVNLNLPQNYSCLNYNFFNDVQLKGTTFCAFSRPFSSKENEVRTQIFDNTILFYF